MTRAAIAGFSQISAAGVGVDALRTALRGERNLPNFPVRRAPTAGFASPADPAILRRLDAFSQRLLAAGALALLDAGHGTKFGEHDAVSCPPNLGLVVVSGYGPLTTAFAFMDQLCDKGDNRASPVLFAGSLHNAPAGQAALALNARGPSLTLTGFRHAFARGLAVALDWLVRGAADRVLLIAADEFHPVIGDGLQRLGRCAPDGRLHPFAFDRATSVPGETCVAFVLERPGDAAPKWGCLSSPTSFRGSLPVSDFDAPVFLAARGDPDEGRGYAAMLGTRYSIVSPQLAVAAYSPLWGSNPTSESMTLAAAALALADRELYPSPDVEGAPAGLNIAPAGPFAADAVHCCVFDARENGVLITISRSS